MSCVRSNWGAVISERSLLLCHLPGSYPNLHGPGKAAHAINQNTGATNLPWGTARKLFPCSIPERWGRQSKGNRFLARENQAPFVFNEGHPDSMKWNRNVQSKSQLSFSVTTKTLFFFHVSFSPPPPNNYPWFCLFVCVTLNGSGRTFSSRVFWDPQPSLLLRPHRLMGTCCLMGCIGL